MSDMMAYAASPPDNQYDNGHSPMGTRTENAGFFRREFIKTNQRRLKSEIEVALADEVGGFNQDELRRVDDSIKEAIEVVSSIDFGEMPWIGISDDCIVSMHWERHDAGVLLTFAGDGRFAFAMKMGPGASYAAGFTERSKADGLPEDIRSEISRLSSLVRANQTAA